MRSRWRWVVMVSALVLGACGGRGGGGGGDAVGPGPGSAGDTAIARTIVLQQADMPSGWRGAAHTEDATERARAAAISACLGRPDPETTRSATVYGADLSMGQTQVSSIATVLNTTQDAKADLDAVRSDRYAGCVTPAFHDDVARQVPAARVEAVAAEALPLESFGDGSVGLRLTADLVYADHTDHLFADLAYLSKARATVSATFFSFNQPFPPTLEQSLVARLGNRIATARTDR
jgi:hypothetical protein